MPQSAIQLPAVFMHIDEHIRDQATDPTQSFIVQAPAGSGKTELLTQRFLRLLSTVTQPEHIVALTFTRKAASEMKERVLEALSKAKIGFTPTSPHQEKTLKFAQNALNQDKSQGWDLHLHPHRLRIMTLDALCQSIAKAIPLLESDAPFTHILNDAKHIYKKAVKEALVFIQSHAPLQNDLKILLHHVDNRYDTLISLCVDLIENRTLWLGHLLTARDKNRTRLEHDLAYIEAHTLKLWKDSLHPLQATRLLSLLRKLAQIESTPNSPRACLKSYIDFDNIRREEVNAIAETLLTSSETLRQGFDHHVGLKKGVCDDETYQSLKMESKTLLSELELNTAFVYYLIQIKSLPYPHYTEAQWAVLEALFNLLPIMVAHLHLAFNEENGVDFSHITQLALEALGDEEHPTDLALHIDYAIQHLLVDEFQDTSIEQYHLLQKLIRGFIPDDGRTLFCVGDPMQSIYRFRQAEVGLFIKAKQQGIGEISLKPLELKANFRSEHQVIEWVNQHFQSIFPTHSDIESGAVHYAPSIPIKPIGDANAIKAIAYDTKLGEAQGVVEALKHTLKVSPNDSIAILVRSRSQLPDIIRAINQAQIPFQGVDMDALSHTPHIMDLMTLTYALLSPACRLSWLSLLRSPLGGINLKDLLTISRLNPSEPILHALKSPQVLEALSQDGQSRVLFLTPILEQAILNRCQMSLVSWVYETFIALQGPYLYTEKEHLDFKAYYRVLEQYDEHGRLRSQEAFEAALKNLYAQTSQAAQVQVMTIHKSKGLEFDTVILPGLSAKSNTAETALIRTLEYTHPNGDGLLISPMKAPTENESLIYNYIGKVEQEKATYELQRLFYVAVTRAKKRLFLFDNKHQGTKGTLRNLLKHQAFECIHTDSTEINTRPLPMVYTLPVERLFIPPAATYSIHKQTPISLAHTHAKPIGTLTHLVLEWICTYHYPYSEINWSVFEQKIQSLGVDKSTQKDMLRQIQNLTKDFLNCPIGQWIAKPHQDEHNEYPLLCAQNNDVVTKIIDRTFVDEGIRWIIDFKTGDDEKHTEHHIQQLSEYAALFKALDTRPIRCGLYYLQTQTWKVLNDEIA